jgi:heme-degrading monooxygenase HmoA
MSEIANTPTPPYYAVIFTSHRTEGDNGYGEMAERMAELAAQQPGYLGMESAREDRILQTENPRHRILSDSAREFGM